MLKCLHFCTSNLGGIYDFDSATCWYFETADGLEILQTRLILPHDKLNTEKQFQHRYK